MTSHTAATAGLSAVAALFKPLAADLDTLTAQVRQRAAGLLESGAASVVLGHRAGWSGWSAVPCMARTPRDAGALVVGPTCGAGLAKYLLDELPRLSAASPAFVVARGCEVLAVRRLIADHRIGADLVRVIAIPCAGRLDERRLAGDDPPAGLRAALAPSCQECRVRWPAEPVAEGGIAEVGGEIIGDRLPALGEWILRLAAEPALEDASLSAAVAALEGLDPADRMAYWSDWFARCIRCHACRAACPACHCETCILEADPTWLGRSTGLSEQFMFQFTRAMDVAGRCVGCGQCERACPVNLPLAQLWSKVAMDVSELFGVEDPFLPSGGEPLGCFDLHDGDPTASRLDAPRRAARRQHD